MSDAGRLTTLHIDTERGWRGGERQVLWLCAALGRLGHRAILAARPDEPLAERARKDGIEVVDCAPRFEFDPFAARRLRALVRGEGVDVVHAHTGHAVSMAALAVRGTDARMVLTRRVDFRLRGNPPTRWKYRQAHGVIAISKAVRRALVESGVPADRIELVPSGVDLARRFTPAPRARLAELGVPEGAPLVVQVSQLVGHKDPVTFVRAIDEARRLVPELRALLVGDGPLADGVDEEIRRRHLRGVLLATGYRTDADDLLAAADVVTLSSEEEGLGTVLLDALSLGKLVAATEAGGIPEVLEHERSGLLAPVHDGERLGANIARLLTEPALAARLAEGARLRAAEFSVERTAERTLAVYRRVLAGAARR